ncbi:MAG TPA: methylmalonyl Co-A mutase-associated GTPase MeaB [Acidimicrobiales bacterium]|nr:methylmalonyl Co-A mutase-associated GTPase MeaB [Acidimicrobiales bacterium]
MRRSDPSELVDAAVRGDRAAVARLISLIERGGPAAREVGRLTYPLGGTAYTVGLTGAPGAGKSTLTNRLIGMIRATDGEVAVLAIDPTSPFSGGAILGDRVRMQDHATDAGVFIRSMATRGHMGGLALATPEAIRVLDAAGFPVVLVETVGVGQVEVEIAGEADTTVVVVTPGWGDSVQANKAGLLEMADVFAINKADRGGAEDTARDLEQMLDLSAPSDWRPPVIKVAAATGDGVDDLWNAVAEHRRFLEKDGRLERRRTERVITELGAIVTHQLAQQAGDALADGRFEQLRAELVGRRTDPYSAAEEVMQWMSDS